MPQSLKGELIALQNRLGPSPVEDIFAGLHHIHYRVPREKGPALVQDILRKTNYQLQGAFLHRINKSRFFLLTLKTSPIGIVVEEKPEPFAGFPRLDSIAFKVLDVNEMKDFLKSERVETRTTFFGVQTNPISGLDDRFSYIAYDGYEWFEADEFDPLEIELGRPDSADKAFLEHISEIDHIAYRIRLHDLKTAAAKLMRLTAYRFDDCYTVAGQNAETIVFRKGDEKPALVASYGWDDSSVVWQYTDKYGPRVHHIAYYTEEIRSVVTLLRKDKILFTTNKLIGNEDRGILQIFTEPSLESHEITEYIQRFDDFTGFFDEHNVDELMGSTKKFS